ncbi:hydrogen peroxide-inducible genes activator [Arcicella sp. LKC2W]|uniref:hydrogen peroxide-inducible genes activator n=1 Tax=Arcicella sp. LKC2W TaxID=2984198 RepID=UPI002B20443D|nr:hydrogen peroxide-inducible genes activator [Arcicella sp. LKC2W]MEA5457423.1 hydrogen peroxide-inducible genes activator [Arcicella sp. LKC2W]
MTITQLEYILAVEKHRNFVQAADSCCVTQPTLSMQIQKLEDELGIKVFDRSRQPVVTTQIGLEILQQARLTISEFYKIKDTVNAGKHEISGEIRLGIIPTLAPYLLPLFLMEYLKKYPSIELKIKELTTDRIIHGLKNDDLDLGLVATPLQQPNLVEHPIFYEELVLYVSKENAIYKKKYAISEDINPKELWLLEEGHCLRSQIENLCELKRKSIGRNQFEYQAGSLETLRKMVERNQGITILPELATMDFDEERLNLIRKFKSPAPKREISLVAHKNFAKSGILKTLKTSILEALPEQVRNNKDTNVLSL